MTRLASAGEAALDTVPLGGPARNAIEAAQRFKDRGEKLLSGLESVGWRLAAIEKRLEALEKANMSVRTPTRPRTADRKPRPSGSSPGPSEALDAAPDNALPDSARLTDIL
jgi:hypothetical protein